MTTQRGALAPRTHKTDRGSLQHASSDPRHFPSVSIHVHPGQVCISRTVFADLVRSPPSIDRCMPVIFRPRAGSLNVKAQWPISGLAPCIMRLCFAP